MSPLQLTDAQRAAAVEAVRQNTVLTSGAGCGKTAVLARRFAELLRDRAGRDDGLNCLVAVTFTDKAAVQMRQRLASLLDDLAREATGDEAEQLRAWIDELPEARISTIHSFCTGLLRSHAITAGVDPAFAVLADPLVAGQMVDEAVYRAVVSAVEGGDQRLADLLSRTSFESVLDTVGQLVNRRIDFDAADYADADMILTRWEKQLTTDRQAAWERLRGDAALSTALDALADIPCSDPADKLAEMRDGQLELARQVLTDLDAWTAETLDQLAKKPGGKGKKDSWGGAEIVKDVRSRLRALAETFEPLAVYTHDLTELDAAAAAHLATLIALAEDAETLYAQAKRARGALDFVDLLAQTDRLLAERPELRKQLAAGLDQLLVDECQDTDRLQMELLWSLVAGEESPTPAPGRLFIVGDAKQSIYRFRGADAGVFQDVAGRLGDDSHLSLDRSFRTHRAGVAFVNHLFDPLLADYEPIEAHRDDVPPAAPVELLLAGLADGGTEMKAPEATAIQAAVTAGRIRELIDSGEPVVWDRQASAYRPARFNDVAILFVRMTTSADYERELAALDIPYYVVAGAGFFHQQEVFDVLNALRVIDDPFNDVALLGVLRSSLVGLDDNALVHLAQTHTRPYLPGLPSDELAERLGPAAAATLTQTVQALGDLHACKDAIALDELVARVVEAFSYEPTLLSQAQGKRKVGNVRLLASHARSAGAEGMSLADFITQMDKLTLTDARYEQAATAGEADNVVRLMTIHKAKGLEFPVVIVPDLNAGSRGPTGRLLWRPDWGWTFKASADPEEQAAYGEPDEPQSVTLARAREKLDDRAETLRKYYVALTRHEDRLILVGADWRTKEGFPTASSSFLRTLDDQLGLFGAVDAGDDTLAYAWDGQTYAARIERRVGLSNTRRQRRSLGQGLLNDSSDGADFARRVLALGDETADLPLVGPLPASAGRAELAVTALCDFLNCPMLYRWRYELRVPSSILPGTDTRSSSGTSVDAATAGTFFHRCMELLDFDDLGLSRGQQVAHPTAERLAGQAAAEMDLTAEQATILTAELTEMLDTFKSHDLYQAIATSQQTSRELDFVISAGPATLRGQIDLLVQGDDGAWRIVDYKSDRIGDTPSTDDVATHSTHHELQMRIYATAAARHLGAPPTEATLYYLRPGVTHTLPLDAATIASIETELGQLAEHLIVTQRSGAFSADRKDACDYCPYRALCAHGNAAD